MPGECIFVAGHNGMVGSSVLRRLTEVNQSEIVVCDRSQLDLLCGPSVVKFLREHKVSQVYICAAKVGGIAANMRWPASFLYDNLCIQNNLIHGAFEVGIKQLLFLGSSCIYPKDSAVPITESALMSGPLEETNKSYAVAKIAGIQMCKAYTDQYGVDYRALMPSNIYGPGDNYDESNSHVVAALIKRFHQAKTAGKSEVVVWGSGKPKREFLFVDDLAEACVRFMGIRRMELSKYSFDAYGFMNVGFGRDIAIADLAKKVSEVVGFKGEIRFDKSKPDGVERKLIDSRSMTSIGWEPSVGLDVGLRLAYKDFLGRYGDSNS